MEENFLLDIFPIQSLMPFRINFFDDSIEEIKFFNTETQISQKSLAKNSLTIFPASEVVASDENRQKALDCLRQRRSKLSVASYQEALQHLESGIFFSGVEKYRCYFSDKQFSWLDLINKDWKIFLWQRDKIDLTLQNHTNEIQEDFQLENSKEPLPPAPEDFPKKMLIYPLKTDTSLINKIGFCFSVFFWFIFTLIFALIFSKAFILLATNSGKGTSP